MNPREPFSRGAVIALVVVGFALFLALLVLIGRGDSPLADTQNGGAHAAAKGLNGYAGFTRLLAASDYRITRSRSPEGLKTRGVLVLTPPASADPDMLGDVLEKRRNLGPTLVILPKWRTSPPPKNLPREAAAKFQRGWVILQGAEAAPWPAALPAPFGFAHKLAQATATDRSLAPRWGGLGQAGVLPARPVGYAEGDGSHEAIITDAAGRALALRTGLEPIGPTATSQPVIFLAEPDLANNFALADPARAAVALALVAELDRDGSRDVTFDLTLNGFGGAENLLTLAFRPPFLAATLCLIMALVLVVGTALDLTPTILILTPVLMPIIKQAGIDPVYFGVMFIMNCCIGLITPPVGVVLNVVSGVGRVPLGKVVTGIVPFLLAPVLVLVLLVIFPDIVIVPAQWLR